MTDKKRDDGGPAFPGPDIYHPGGEIEFGAAGMTLRDYFAGQAMQGMVTGSLGTIGNHKEVSAYANGSCNEAIADRAYVLADAMIAARNHETEAGE